MTRMKENIIAVVATLLLTWWVIVFIWSGWNNLATDLLWKKIQTEQEADMSFKLNSDKAQVVLNKDIENLASISFELSFDKSKLDISKDSLDSKYAMSLAKTSWWNSYNVILQNVWDLKSKDPLFFINNITKNQFDNINIGHIQVIDNNWNTMDLTSSK